MKKTLQVIGLMIGLVVIWVTALPLQDAHSNTSGSNSGKTGSPGDGQNCTQCHAGTPTTQTGLITVNTPSNGYVPGVTYQVTATVTFQGRTKFGFQVSPQNTTGQQLGTLTATNTTETQTQVNGKYITHKTAGTSGPNGTKTWTFDWTAPAPASGPVTLYGAFNCTNSMSNSAGDVVYLSEITVQEDLSLLVTEDNLIPGLTVFPVPANDFVEFRAPNAVSDFYSVDVYDISGSMVQTSATQTLQGYRLNISELPSGIYFVKVYTPEGFTVRRILKS
ncbi:MAG: T9SS type A sorting domain-containing protein [Bacteroidetes bacterium]|nr:T9SS type A sorting domain-containing protein [Bacteroidota bacterium]